MGIWCVVARICLRVCWSNDDADWNCTLITLRVFNERLSKHCFSCRIKLTSLRNPLSSYVIEKESVDEENMIRMYLSELSLHLSHHIAPLAPFFFRIIVFDCFVIVCDGDEEGRNDVCRANHGSADTNKSWGFQRSEQMFFASRLPSSSSSGKMCAKISFLRNLSNGKRARMFRHPANCSIWQPRRGEVFPSPSSSPSRHTLRILVQRWGRRRLRAKTSSSLLLGLFLPISNIQNEMALPVEAFVCSERLLNQAPSRRLASWTKSKQWGHREGQ